MNSLTGVIQVFCIQVKKSRFPEHLLVALFEYAILIYNRSYWLFYILIFIVLLKLLYSFCILNAALSGRYTLGQWQTIPFVAMGILLLLGAIFS